MPKFQYKAKEGPNKIIDGMIDATSLDMAIAKVTQLGLTPIDVFPSGELQEDIPAPSVKPKFQFFRRVSLNETIAFTRQMSDLVDAHVPMLKALQLIARQTKNPNFQSVLEDIYLSVRDGGSLSASLARHPELFSDLYINLVRTGELSGKLEMVMSRLADYLEKNQETRSKIKTSLTYPLFILGVGVLVIIVLMTFVIPNIASIFEDMDHELPRITQILIGLSRSFVQFGWLLLIAILFLGYYLYLWLNSARGRIARDLFLLRMPVVGNFITTTEVGQFARTLGTLVESGVVITTALESVQDTMQNVILKEEVKKIHEDVTNGASLKNALRKSPFFPETAVNMISVGEETGHLERGLLKTADTFERQSDQIVKRLLSLLGPITILIIMIFVGFVVIAMLLPLLTMNSLIQ